MAKHRSMRGEIIDLNKLAAKAEDSITVGNTNTNARGDELGRRGKVVKKADQVARDHYNNNNPKSVKMAGLKVDDWEEPDANPEPAPKKAPEPATKKAPDPAPKKAQSKIVKEQPQKNDDQWVEDAEGNFVRKEDK